MCERSVWNEWKCQIPKVWDLDAHLMFYTLSYATSYYLLPYTTKYGISSGGFRYFENFRFFRNLRSNFEDATALRIEACSKRSDFMPRVHTHTYVHIQIAMVLTLDADWYFNLRLDYIVSTERLCTASERNPYEKSVFTAWDRKSITLKRLVSVPPQAMNMFDTYLPQ